MKLIVFEEQKLTTISIETKPEWSLGRLNSDIVLNSNIAGRHQGILRKENNNWFFIDGGSSNGTYYNAEKMMPQTQVRLKPGDILRIDNRAMNMPQGVILLCVQDEVHDNWKVVDLSAKEKTFIGRSQQNCDVYLPNLQISRQHACVQDMNGQYYVHDCESQLGTALNNYGIRGASMLQEGDVISVAENPIYFSGHYLFYNQIEFNSNQPLVSPVTYRETERKSQNDVQPNVEYTPVPKAEPIQQPQVQWNAYVQQRPENNGALLKTDRSLLMYLFLSLITCGFYSYYFLYQLAKDINIVCENDGEKTPGLLAFILLNCVTCGIYSYYWYYKIADRMYKNAPRYGFEFEESGSTVLTWLILGAFLCGSGVFIAMYIVFSNANKICKAYNRGH